MGRPQAVRNCGAVRGIARRLDRDVDDWLGESIPFEQQAQVGLGRGVGVLANLGECPDALFLPLERVAWVDEFSEFGQSGPSVCGVAAYQRVAEFYEVFEGQLFGRLGEQRLGGGA